MPGPLDTLTDLLVPVDSLAHYPGNARTHADAVLRESLELNGQYRPVVVWQVNRQVLAGNGTLAAARDLGWHQIAATFVDVDEDAARRINLVDNRTNDLAAYDERALAELLQDVGPDLTGTGYDQAALDELLAHLGTPPSGGSGDPDEVPELPGKPQTAPGDLWLLGSHRVLCGDATEPEDMARLFGERRHADLVVTDPPYAIYGSSSGLSSDVTDDKIVRPFFEALFRLVESRLGWFDHAYVFTDWRSWAAVWEGAKRGGMVGKNCIVWDKGGAGLGNNYANTHEFVGFFHKLPASGTMTSGRKTGIRPVLASNILRFPRVMGDEREHNAAKPVALCAVLIGNSSQVGQVVFDPFGGSGSTLIAAEEVGRVCLTSDIEPKWVDVICRRWQRFTGDKPVLDATGEPHDFTA